MITGGVFGSTNGSGVSDTIGASISVLGDALTGDMVAGEDAVELTSGESCMTGKS